MAAMDLLASVEKNLLSMVALMVEMEEEVDLYF
jgi:hypothetical protein